MSHNSMLIAQSGPINMSLVALSAQAAAFAMGTHLRTKLSMNPPPTQEPEFPHTQTKQNKTLEFPILAFPSSTSVNQEPQK